MRRKILYLLIILIFCIVIIGCSASNQTESDSERFVEVYSQSRFMIYKDSVTNVHYLVYWDAYKGGITPLLDGEGNALTAFE